MGREETLFWGLFWSFVWDYPNDPLNLPYTSLKEVDGLTAVRVHPILLHAEVDALLESLAERVSVEEGHQDAYNLHQQDSSNTDAVLQLWLK